tara:strand:+ start:1946 stop:2356 length:411 start_codon:yes stop_codon:yes gene_type:complete
MDSSSVFLVKFVGRLDFYGKHSSKGGSSVACFTHRKAAEVCVSRIRTWKKTHFVYPPIDGLKFIAPNAPSGIGDDLQIIRANLDFTEQTMGVYGLSVLLFEDEWGQDYSTITYDVPVFMKREKLEHQFCLDFIEMN